MDMVGIDADDSSDMGILDVAAGESRREMGAG